MPNVLGATCGSHASVEIEECNMQKCDTVDGEWGDWSAWGACTCTGLQERHRVVKVHAREGGKQLEGPKVETRKCTPDCTKPPIDCKLSDFSGWSSCSMPCGGGIKVRTRSVERNAQN